MMTTKRRARVLKAADIGQNAIVSVSPTRVRSERISDGDGPAIFTAADVEQLCAEARSVGAAEAAVALEAPLQRIAAGLTDLSSQDAEVQSTARRADAEAVAEAAIDVARWIIGCELADEQIVLNLVDRALSASGNDQVSRVLVHPDLADVLAEIAPDDLNVIGDTNIVAGEFTIVTDGPDISLRIESALATARAELLVEDDA